jgi:hypothetical protein
VLSSQRPGCGTFLLPVKEAEVRNMVGERSSSCYCTIWDGDWDISLRRILLECQSATSQQLGAALAARDCTTLADAKRLLCAPSNPLASSVPDSALAEFREKVIAAPPGECALTACWKACMMDHMAYFRAPICTAMTVSAAPSSACCRPA